MTKIWAFADTHCRHTELDIPADIDLVICAGDSSNHWDVNINHGEELRFLDWYGKLPIKSKIFVGGNHNTALGQGLITKEQIESYGLIYLQDSTTEIQGLKIWGSPWSPTFGRSGRWGFNKSRQKLGEYWKSIDYADIIVSHSPPYGLLDEAYDIDDRSKKVHVGCKGLKKYCERQAPILNIFGHIHSSRDIMNHGVRIVNNTTYINASCQHDHSDKFNQGVIWELPDKVDPEVSPEFTEEVLGAEPFPTIDYKDMK